MDKGEFFKHEFEVLPASGGGFIITLGSNYNRFMNNRDSERGRFATERWAFSNVEDLLQFLRDQIYVPTGDDAGNSLPSSDKGE